jgi:hypothetical protein
MAVVRRILMKSRGKVKLDQNLRQLMPLGFLDKHPFEVTVKQLHDQLDAYVRRHGLAVVKHS